jgi:hypothetical protein
LIWALPNQSLHNHDDCISHEKSEEPSHPTVNLPHEDRERGRNSNIIRRLLKGESERHNGDTSSDGHSDMDNNNEQNHNYSKGPQSTKQPWSPSLNFNLSSIVGSKQRLRGPRHIRSRSPVQPATACDANSNSNSDDGYKDNEDSDGSESPRPAKRRQPFPSNSDPTSKRTHKHHRQPSHKCHTTPVQTQPVQCPSILPIDHLQSKIAPNSTSAVHSKHFQIAVVLVRETNCYLTAS